MQTQDQLFDMVSADYVIGYIMHNPVILYQQDKYILTTEDFYNESLKTIFGLVYNLVFAGANTITPEAVQLYVASFPAQNENFKKNSMDILLKEIYNLVQIPDENTFAFYYERVKKFTVLRELFKQGISIDEFYHPSLLDQDEALQQLDKISIKDILVKVRNRIQIVENRNASKEEISGQSAAKGIRQLVKKLAEQPEAGLPLQGQILNYAARGCRKGKMYMYSSNSGGGKTRHMVGNACSLAYPYIENGKVIVPDELHPVLFIATEMQCDEIQTLILAWISGVNEEKILLGPLTPDESRLLNIAMNIMEQYDKNFIIESLTNPSIQTIKAKITSYILQENIEYVFYDYIFNSPGLISEFAGAGLREDVVLMLLANTLKEIAATYNIFLFTGTQLSGDYNKKCVRDARYLRGSKALADKIDLGMIGLRVPAEEADAIKVYTEQMHTGNPNIVIDIYKNRRGKMCEVKIFKQFDYGTCRSKDLFVTDSNYQMLGDLQVLDTLKTERPLTDYE